MKKLRRCSLATVRLYKTNDMIDLKISVVTELIKVSEYGQEIPQSPTADQPTAPLGRATEG